MPLNKYFHGSGEKVMSKMKEEYGEEKGERVFYATVNKHPGQKPKGEGGRESKSRLSSRRKPRIDPWR